MSGMVVDAVSGEPVPAYGLQLSDGSGRSEFVRSDSSGHFRTHEECWSPGNIIVLPKETSDSPDYQNNKFSIEYVGAGVEVSVPVRVGPTFHLKLSIPAGTKLEDVRARLVAGDGSSFWVWMSDFENASTIHEDITPWVRINCLSEELASSEAPWQLWLFTRDRQWHAHAAVNTLHGNAPGTLEIALRPAPHLSGEVTDGSRPLDQVQVSILQRTSDGSIGGGPTIRADESGRFDLGPVLPGSYSVTAIRDRYPSKTIEVAIADTPGSPVNFTLLRTPGVGAIAGRVRTSSGKYTPDGGIALRRTDVKSSAEYQKLEWSSEGGHKVGSFRFDDLPAGEYDIELSVGDWFDWTPRKLHASPPNESLEFVCHDEVPRAILAIEAFDAATKKHLQMGDIHCLSGPDYSWGTNVHGDEPQELGVVPLDAPLQWTVSAEGYIASSGGVEAFEDAGTQDGQSLRVARVMLKRGWGTRLRVFDANGEGIDGVQVLLDGVDAGTTGAKGDLNVALPARPKGIELRYKDWRVVRPERFSGVLPPEQKPEGITFIQMSPP